MIDCAVSPDQFDSHCDQQRCLRLHIVGLIAQGVQKSLEGMLLRQVFISVSEITISRHFVPDIDTIEDFFVVWLDFNTFWVDCYCLSQNEA